MNNESKLWILVPIGFISLMVSMIAFTIGKDYMDVVKTIVYFPLQTLVVVSLMSAIPAFIAGRIAMEGKSQA